MNNSSVIIRSVKDRNLQDVIEELMDLCNWKDIVKPGNIVVVKPNLCTERKDIIHIANTSLAIIECVCRILKKVTDNVIIGESDGVRYKAEEAFQNTGVYEIAAKLGVKAISFSKDEQVEVASPVLGKWSFSKTFLDADVFISLPVIKTHGITVFTGTLKNQWGCVPNNDRIKWHQHLDKLLVEVNKVKKPDISIIDGIIGMQGNGPISGFPINLNVLLASRDPVALDGTSMRLVGLLPESSKHIVLAEKAGLGNLNSDKITVDGDFEKYCIKIEPAVQDWAIKMMSLFVRSPFLIKHFILNDKVFFPIRRMVKIIRKIKNIGV
jgi:uncharacterized protein (DUF362 family)